MNTRQSNLSFARPCTGLESLHALSQPRTTPHSKQKLDAPTAPIGKPFHDMKTRNVPNLSLATAPRALLPGFRLLQSDSSYQHLSELLAATNLVSQEVFASQPVVSFLIAGLLIYLFLPDGCGRDGCFRRGPLFYV